MQSGQYIKALNLHRWTLL